MALILTTSTRQIYQMVIHVLECPSSQDDFVHREKFVSCPDGTRYHCLMNMEMELVELCMSSYVISRGI